MNQPNIDNNLLTALVSGTTTAALVGTITYPLDFIKTQSQLNNVKSALKYGIPSNSPSSLAQLFKGGSALVIGNVLKNSARLFLYHWLSNFMALEGENHNGNHKKKTTAPRIVIAGIMSGFLETLWLIPFENIKITMIQNMSLTNEIERCNNQGNKVDVTGYSIPNKHHKPSQNVFKHHYISPHAYYTSDLIAAYKGLSQLRFSTHIVKHTKTDQLKYRYNQHPSLTFLGAVREIYNVKGLRGFSYGGCITLVRQVAISSIWLSTYNWTKQLYLPHNKSHDGWFGDSYTVFQLVALQVVASTAVITCTQPLDVIKSHMQLKNSHTIYRDSLRTAYRLVLDNGLGALYRGTLPRGIKVLVSGGLSANFYAYFEQLFATVSTTTVFSE